MAANSNLLISITAKDQASGTFRRIKVSLGELEKDAGEAGDAIGDLGKIFSSGLGKIAGGIGGFFAVGQLAQTAVELGKIGAQSERTRAAYGDLAAAAGVSAQSMLQAMRQATAGTVADSELMLNANRAMMLGVADNAEEMSRLMAAAIERGRALGVSSAQAINDIVTGIGRMSPLILDNLGITGAAQAFDKYAESLGKTAEQLTDVEKKQALVNAVLAQSSGVTVANDAAAAFERMDASIQNAKEALGVLFSPAIAAIADRLAEAATITAQALTVDPLAQAEATLSARVQELRRQAQDAAVWSVAPGAPVGPGDLMSTELSDQAQRMQLLLFAIQEVDEAQKAGISSADAWANQLMRLAERTIAFGEVSDSSLRQLALLLGDIATTTSAEQLREAAEAMGALSDATRPTAEQIAATNASLREMADTGATAAETIAQISAQAQGQLAGIAQSVAAIQGEQAGLDWLDEMNRQLDEQIAKWIAEGRTVAQITGVLLPNFLDNLRKVTDESNKAATAVERIGKGAYHAGTLGERMMAGLAIKIGTVTRAATLAAGALARMNAAATAISTGRGGGLGEGFRSIDYIPIEKATDSATAFERALGDLLDTASTGGIGGGGIGGVSDAFDDLRSKIEGVISGATQGDIGGLNPADFLPREDAINENARRLAAIMRDGIGNQEWMEEFKAEVPGIFEEIASSSDPRGKAARILQEFQQGLRPELLDREQIKERVRAMILGDQNTAALAQEIAGELSAELGVSLGQAQQAVAGVMGTSGGGLEGVKAGPNGTVEGTAFVNAWVKVVTGLVDQFDATGQTAGTAFSAGFLSTQSALLDSWASALVGKLIPAVVAALAAQSSRTGAQ